MTDEQPDEATETPVPKPPTSVAVVAAEAFEDVLDRLEHLEAQQPALDADDAADDAEVDLVQARLGRHRQELEAIKGAINKIVRFLRAGEPLPAVLPPAPVETPAETPAEQPAESGVSW